MGLRLRGGLSVAPQREAGSKSDRATVRPGQNNLPQGTLFDDDGIESEKLGHVRPLFDVPLGEPVSGRSDS